MIRRFPNRRPKTLGIKFYGRLWIKKICRSWTRTTEFVQNKSPCSRSSSPRISSGARGSIGVRHKARSNGAGAVGALNQSQPLQTRMPVLADDDVVMHG